METFPNIEEFDLVIIALPTFTQKILDRIPSKPLSISEQIGTLFETGRPVWCIIEKMLTPTRPEAGPKARPSSVREQSNYDWLFVVPALKVVGEGHSLERQKEGDQFEAYLSTVKKWNLEIETIREMRLASGNKSRPPFLTKLRIAESLLWLFQFQPSE
jgi:hypothetical protein